jgi:hypothetical protein
MIDLHGFLFGSGWIVVGDDKMDRRSIMNGHLRQIAFVRILELVCCHIDSAVLQDAQGYTLISEGLIE